MDGGVVRQRLERALRDGLRARDTVAVPALRSALAEIDNAGAIRLRREAGVLTWALDMDEDV